MQPQDVWLVYIITIFYKKKSRISNSVDPDQTPHVAASDLGIHCSPMFPFKDAGHKWVKQFQLFLSVSKVCLSISYGRIGQKV